VYRLSVRISKGLKQAYDLQDFTFEAALALQRSLTKEGILTVTREDAQAIKNVVGAWQSAQARVAFHRRAFRPFKATVEPTKQPAGHREQRPDLRLETERDAPPEAQT
jgi:hypothetical protein